MKMVLVRHGDYDSNGLTQWGQEEVRKTASEISKRLGSPELVLTWSHKDRAQQTAEILAEAFGLQARFENVMFPMTGWEDIKGVVLAQSTGILVFVMHLQDYDPFVNLLRSVYPVDWNGGYNLPGYAEALVADTKTGNIFPLTSC